MDMCMEYRPQRTKHTKRESTSIMDSHSQKKESVLVKGVHFGRLFLALRVELLDGLLSLRLKLLALLFLLRASGLHE